MPQQELVAAKEKSAALRSKEKAAARCCAARTQCELVRRRARRVVGFGAGEMQYPFQAEALHLLAQAIMELSATRSYKMGANLDRRVYKVVGC